jgi:hypothetical protein
MSRKLLLVAAWFPLTLVLVLINLSILVGYAHGGYSGTRLSAVAPQDTAFQLAAAGTSQVLSASVIAADARVYLVESFLKDHRSPMSPYAGLIVSEADRLGLDFRLIPAIAMCESNAGKHMPKKKEFNFAGIAVYTGQNEGKAFDSWEHAITWVSEYVKSRYYDRGLTDLKDIGAIWAPPSVEAGDSWAKCVESFQTDII